MNYQISLKLILFFIIHQRENLENLIVFNSSALLRRALAGGGSRNIFLFLIHSQSKKNTDCKINCFP